MDIYILFIFLFTLTSLIERFIYDSVFIKTGDIYISTIPLSILIFVLCITKIKEKDNILCKVGRKSFGIYVVHIASPQYIFYWLLYFLLNQLSYH